MSVFDSGFMSGYGIYETLYAQNGEVSDIKIHIKRLFKSAKLVYLKLPWRQEQIEKWVSEIGKQAKKSMRLRITVSFEPTIVIHVETLAMLKSSCYKAITYEIERILPEAKTNCLLPQYLARREMARKKAQEVLLINRHGEITEGSVTNVFFVRNGILMTPKDGILKGTMRGRVIKIARKLKIPIEERAIKKFEKFDECFVTNSLRFVVPVLSIDGKRISGRIGALTAIIKKYVDEEYSKHGTGARDFERARDRSGRY